VTKKIIAETISGKVEGAVEGGINIFKGIPYAAPPVGVRRWLPPAPPRPWQGVRSARAFGNVAAQMDSGPGISKDLEPVGPQSEDCLFLNVWTPALNKAARPVLFWVHGGAFSMGSASEPMYDGGSLAARGDTVIVSINYRLGVFGFLRLKEATGGAIPSTGNEGLLDQIAALEWVRHNIAAFGGDPGNVTVFGESAGAMSIGCLMAMPAARGLFHKAILQSGAANTTLSSGEAIGFAEEYLNVLGVSPGGAGALRELPVERLLGAEMELRRRVPSPAGRPRLTLMQPVVDGDTLPSLPIEAIRRGSAAGISLLAGTNQEEWKLMASMDPDLPGLDKAGLLNRCEDFLPAGRAAGLVEAYQKARPAATPGEIFTAIQTDRVFRIPAIRLLEAQGKHAAAYNYLFTWKSPAMGGQLGSCHVLEVGFVFGLYKADFCGAGPAADRLSANVQQAWLEFARTGDPGHPGIGPWPPYGAGRSTMLLGEDRRVEKAVFEGERQAWDAVPDICIGQV